MVLRLINCVVDMEETAESKKQSRIALQNAKRRNKKKEKKLTAETSAPNGNHTSESVSKVVNPIPNDVNIVYVSSNDNELLKKLAEENKDYEELAKVFEKFQTVEELLSKPAQVN